MEPITIELTGPDWKPKAHNRFYAQRGQGLFAFGSTEHDALHNLLDKERLLNKKS